MPYRKLNNLPQSVRDHLTEHAQDMYMEAFNNAYEQYDRPEERRGASREETAHRVAWAAVKQKYEKDERSGDWKATGEKPPLKSA